MAKLMDCSMEYFLREVYPKKKIIAFGAGRKFVKFISDFSFEKKIEFVVDNDIKKQGTTIELNGVAIRVEEVQKLVQFAKRTQDFIILITNLASYVQIMEQLNQIAELECIECYHANMMLSHCKAERVIYTIGEQKIPKVIHYCWFGKNPIPDKLQKCIDSWSKYCPDYKIIRWDESNYDVTKNKYMKEAYDCGKWGFVPDYARLDIVGMYGGIYLDTDVEMIKSFDDLLYDESFYGFMDYNQIAIGLGFGARAGNDLVLELRDYYNDKKFMSNDGEMNLLTCVAYQAPVFDKYGFELINKQQNINGNMVYPVEVFAPTGTINWHKLFTANTHSIHHCARTWETECNNKDLIESKKRLKNIEIIKCNELDNMRS